MHHACNLKCGWHEGMERIPHKLIWWPLVVSRGHGWDIGPWSSNGIYGQIGVQKVFGQFWVQGIGDQFWLRLVQLWFGTHLALRDQWLPPLAPFGSIGLGQKGPNWPADRSPRAVGAVVGLNGPKKPFRPKPPQ
ncbi:hypothetical protein O181_120596 [Austropuccinia psidii MF-1]|uniref:Uncharacterized protein n=1 Tax=Austropuccinia psidii MF-1 TaxID=1389203 RepID=A0A9Q3Q0Q0_9BASI|nr:hypothetical protein [Austropuccinia psidii MF-1]